MEDYDCVISTLDARGIAAWYASPGTDGIHFAQLATTGRANDPQGLMQSIERELSGLADDNVMKGHLLDLQDWAEREYAQDLCAHQFVAGMVYVDVQDLESVMKTRDDVTCEKCDFNPNKEWIDALYLDALYLD